MTGEGQVLPGESRVVSWKQGPLGRTLEHRGIWKEAPVDRERSIGLLETGHVRETGVTWEMASSEGQRLNLALKENATKRCLPSEKLRTVSLFTMRNQEIHILFYCMQDDGASIEHLLCALGAT